MRETVEPETMYSTSSGALRRALDRLRRRLDASARWRMHSEARRLALLAVQIAKRWRVGDPHDDIAAELLAQLEFTQQ